MYVILTILKILGIILLVLLVLLLFIVFSVLFVPVRYRLEGEKIVIFCEAGTSIGIFSFHNFIPFPIVRFSPFIAYIISSKWISGILNIKTG